MALQHKWKKPRQTIATRYQHNDFGYVTNGAVGANGIYALFDMKPSVSKQLTALDYGCGTGRVSRPQTPLYAKIACYDPVVECIAEFHKEIKQCEMSFPNLIITSDFNQIPVCDVAWCINVIEHLEADDALQLVQNLQSKVTGDVVINYRLSRASNMDALAAYLTPEEIVADTACGIQLRKLNLHKRIGA